MNEIFPNSNTPRAVDKTDTLLPVDALRYLKNPVEISDELAAPVLDGAEKTAEKMDFIGSQIDETVVDDVEHEDFTQGILDKLNNRGEGSAVGASKGDYSSDDSRRATGLPATKSGRLGLDRYDSTIGKGTRRAVASFVIAAMLGYGGTAAMLGRAPTPAEFFKANTSKFNQLINGDTTRYEVGE